MSDSAPRRRLKEAEVERAQPSGFHKVVAHALLLGGRVLSLVTIAVVARSHVTQDEWRTAPLDDAGFTTAGLPTASVVLLFCLGMALPFIIFPVGSTALATRDGTRLTVRAVLGRRTADLSAARLRTAIIPGRGPDTYMASVRSGWRWAIVAASETWYDTDYRILDGYDVWEDGSLLPTVRGWVFMLGWVLLVLVVVTVGGAIAGTF